MRYWDRWVKNFSVIKSQWRDYVIEVRTVVIPGIKDATGVMEKGHKSFAFVEEFIDKQPRLCAYAITVAAVYWLASKVFGA